MGLMGHSYQDISPEKTQEKLPLIVLFHGVVDGSSVI